MKRLLFVFFVFLLPVLVVAQGGWQKQEVRVIRSFDALKRADGLRMSPRAFSVDKGKNSIAGVDSFDKFRFCVVSVDGQEYLCLRKYYVYESFRYPMIQKERVKKKFCWGALIDIESFRGSVRGLLPRDNLFVFDVLGYEPANAHRHLPGTGVPDLGAFTPKQLVVKFRLDELSGTARFLIYFVSVQNDIIGLSKVELANESINSAVYKVLTSDGLFDNFFYEVSDKRFLDFLLSAASVYR